MDMGSGQNNAKKTGQPKIIGKFNLRARTPTHSHTMSANLAQQTLWEWNCPWHQWQHQAVTHLFDIVLEWTLVPPDWLLHIHTHT